MHSELFFVSQPDPENKKEQQIRRLQRHSFIEEFGFSANILLRSNPLYEPRSENRGFIFAGCG